MGVTKTTSENKYELLEPWIMDNSSNGKFIMNTKSWVILFRPDLFQIFEI